MLNSTIVANINGSLPASRKVSSQHSSLVLQVNFSNTDVKKTLTVAGDQQALASKSAVKNRTNAIYNGQGKRNCTLLDQNRNPQSKQMKLVNSNKNSGEGDDAVPVPKVCLYPGKIVSEWQQTRKIGAGLVNLGNSCFMNTVLQCLTYCPPLANYLLHESDHSSKCRITGFCMMCELQRHIKRAISRPGEPIKPYNVYHKLQYIAKNFQIGRQEDAHEFLRYVVDNLWKACLANYDGYAKLDPASKETTVINQIFGGYHRSQVICLRCNGKSNTYDHFMDLMLDVKQNVPTLEMALEKFIQPELLRDENSYKCPQCKMKVQAEKMFTIYKAPNVATLQFKRFDLHRIGGKITKHITYPESLNLRPYMSVTKGPPVMYRLNAVLVHAGSSCGAGHYYCFVKNSNGLWYVMDDARVQPVPFNQVLNQNAYILFYLRVNVESGAIKKPVENSVAGVRNNHVLKNGFVGVRSSSPNAHVSLKAKTPALPVVSKLVESPQTNGLQNGVSKHKQILQPVPQKRNKVVFTIGANRSAVGKASPVGKIESSNAKTATPKPVLNGNTLVPYIEDSSEDVSEDDNGKASECGFKSSHAKAVGIEKSTKNNAVPFKLSSANINNVVPCLSEESYVDKEKASAKKVEHSLTNGLIHPRGVGLDSSVSIQKEKQSKTVSSINPLSSSQSSVKVNATSSWNVVEMNHHSPSVASGSSTTSVNSTTDWSIVDQESKRSSLNSSGIQIFKNHERNSKVSSKICTSVEAKLARDSSDAKKQEVPTAPDLIMNRQNIEKRDELNVKPDSAPKNASLSKSPVTASAPNLLHSDFEQKTNVVSVKRSNVPQNIPVCDPVDKDSPPNDDHKEPKQPFRNQSFQFPRTDTFLKSPNSIRQEIASSRDSETKKQSSFKRSISNASEDAGTKWPSRFSNPHEDSSVPVSKKFKADLNSSKCERKHITVDNASTASYSSKHFIANQDVRNPESGQSPSENRKHSSFIKTKDSDSKKQPGLKASPPSSYEHSAKSSPDSDQDHHLHRTKFYNNFTKGHKHAFNSNHSTVGDSVHNHPISQMNNRTSINQPITSSMSHNFIKGPHKNASWQDSGRNKSQVSFFKAKRSHEHEKGDGDNSDSSSSNCNSKGRFEYAWVERTKETIDREYKNTDPECKMKNSNSWFSNLERNKNSNIVSDLQQKSNSLFGTDVGSWNNCQRSPEFTSRPRNCFDDYDDELDKGKMKRIKKHQDRSHYDYNPFEAFVHSRKMNKGRFNDNYRRPKYYPKQYRYQDRYYNRPYKSGQRYFSKDHHGKPRHPHRH